MAAIDPDDAQDIQAMMTEEVVQEPVRVEKTPGRNEPCFCGSGKKYKLCHGR
jgi:preprotein translocase subunit SecA